ncbi:MAG: STAS domain-containing protein [Acidimicrobiales bacterium]|nr:STAS domain-containing protein [Acidimicrobiales bacterium]
MREPGHFEVSGGRNGDTEHLRLGGELDIASIADLQAALEATSATRLVLDLSGLTFIDSSGAAALVRAQQEAASEGRTVALRAPSKPVARVFGLLGMASVLETAD